MEADYSVVIHLHISANSEYEARKVGEDVCRFIYAYKEIEAAVEDVKND